MPSSFKPYDDGPPPENEPPGEQEPGEVGDDSGFPSYVMQFYRTGTDASGEEPPAEDGRVSITPLVGVDPDELALTLIPVYENAGWVFESLSVTTQHVETYDPRNA